MSHDVLTLIPECVLPGCHEPVIAEGEPCAGCIEAFGPHLVPVARAPITATVIAERDAATSAAYVAMLTPEAAPVESERKQNQRCWLCEERRTCTLVAGRWECDGCAASDDREQER